MKRSILITAVSLLFFQMANARPGVVQSKLTQGQTNNQKEQSQSPEFLESVRLNAQVIKLFAERKYDEALPLAKRALELREKSLGVDHPNLSPLLLNLGELSMSKKRYGDAQSYFERALKIDEKALGTDDTKIAKILDRLALSLFSQREDKKAETLLQRALTIRETKLGAENPEVAQNLFLLAELYRAGNEYQKAEPLYQRAIQIREKEQGNDKSDLIKALNAYALLLFQTERTNEGLEVQKRIAQLSSDSHISEGGVLNGAAISLPKPEYPAAARTDRASGIVRVRVTIDETGKVIEAKAIEDGLIHVALRMAAEEAARKAKFSPTLLSGVPVKVTGVIIYNFVGR